MPLPWQEGGAFWPWYMVACLVLALWGVFSGSPRAAIVPGCLLLGLILTRAAVGFAHEAILPMWLCAVWLCIAVVLGMIKAWVPALCCGLSAWGYVALWPFGYRIEHLGLMPIVSDVFFLLGVGSVGLGLALSSWAGNARGYGPLLGVLAVR